MPIKRRAINYIDVRIPYEPRQALGQAYNRAMQTVIPNGWVLFKDDDVYLRVQPAWYQICLDAIAKVGGDAGFITCYTNRIACPQQRAVAAPKNDNIAEHVVFAEAHYKKFGYSISDISRVHPSGFFFLTNKTVWEKVGGFRPGFLGVDNNYAGKALQAGYKLYRIDGLYVYHGYRREWHPRNRK